MPTFAPPPDLAFNLSSRPAYRFLGLVHHRTHRLGDLPGMRKAGLLDTGPARQRRSPSPGGCPGDPEPARRSGRRSTPRPMPPERGTGGRIRRSSPTNSSGRSAPRTGGGAPSSQASAVAARHPVRRPGVDLEGRKPPWWSGSRNPGVQKIERPIENRRSATGNPDRSTAANRGFQASGNSGFQDFLPNDASSGRLFSTSTLQRIRNAENRNREL